MESCEYLVKNINKDLKITFSQKSKLNVAVENNDKQNEKVKREVSKADFRQQKDESENLKINQ